MVTSDFYLNDIWKRTLRDIYESGIIADDVFSDVFESAKIESIQDNVAVISSPSFLSYTIMQQYRTLVESTLSAILEEKVIVDFKEEKNRDNSPKTSLLPINDFKIRDVNPDFTFTNFVVGRSNAQAQVASLTCANNLGILYNPLFIYGNSGLGKTHLLNAIGNQVKEIFPNKKIGIISGLDFVEGVAKSIKEKQIDEFKQYFNELDVLLVDDIQFIAGKDKTHEIFFSVFNSLVNDRKQICITADRIPSEIKGLEERIISRFNQGLNVNVEAPEYETSINILKMKIANNVIRQQIDDEVLSYIATNFSQDVRKLEGAINRLIFYAIDFSNEEHITLKLAMEAFKDEIPISLNELNIEKVIKTVCDYYNLTKQQIVSKARTKNISNARQIAMYLSRKLLDVTYDDIGYEFGKRDHSTVMSSCEIVEKRMKEDSIYFKAISDIESRLK